MNYTLNWIWNKSLKKSLYDYPSILLKQYIKTVASSNSSDIFNYDFDWYYPNSTDSIEEFKEECCKKYKNKGERKCNKCPKRRP